MHEFIFYNIGRLETTGEVTCFFLLHGLLVGIEVNIKRAANGKLCLPPVVSRPLTAAALTVCCFGCIYISTVASSTVILSRKCLQFEHSAFLEVPGEEIGVDEDPEE
nr:acyl-CoA--sterol O-acyltransferase 1-like [Tanacetum cinerariifolium]